MTRHIPMRPTRDKTIPLVLGMRKGSLVLSQIGKYKSIVTCDCGNRRIIQNANWIHNPDQVSCGCAYQRTPGKIGEKSPRQQPQKNEDN